MAFQPRLASSGDRELSAGQEAACRRAESGKTLTEHDLGTLRVARLYAAPSDARRDWSRREDR